MRKLFETEQSIVKKIREVVQLLLTDAFSDAKSYWLTSISTLISDFNENTLNSFGTDKKVTFHHIRDMFKRKYQYICSSNRCPSKSIQTDVAEDFVSDVSLHTPKDRSYG